MKRIIIFILLMVIYVAQGYAATIQYISVGRDSPKVKIAISRNNGTSWENKELNAGQTFTIPKDTTNLRIDNIPYDPSKNYKIKEGNVY